MHLYTNNKHHLSWLMVGGEAPLTWCNFDEMTLGTWYPNDTDLSRLQHLNFGCKGEVCKSIRWQQFTTLYFKDGFLIKSRNTALWSNTRDVCASAFKGAVLDSWHAREEWMA